MSSAIDGVLEYLKGTKDAWQPTINQFPEVDVPQLARDMELEARGLERAARGSVQRDDLGLDPVERDIVEDVRRRARTAKHEYFSMLELYEARLRDAAIGDGAFVQIKGAAEVGLANFKGQAAGDQLPLDAESNKVDIVCRQFDAFVVEHRLRDVAPQSSRVRQTLPWIAILVVFESVVNGVFFAKGSETGLVGGFAEAIFLSLLNIGVAALIGLFALRYVRHVSTAWKVTAVVTLLAFVTLGLSLNLLIAHYRDAFAVSAGQAVDFSLVLQSFKGRPFALADAKSWLLGVIGVGLSVIAAYKLFQMQDPYPGFGKLAKRRDAAIDDLAAMRERCIAQLTAHRDKACEDMNRVIFELEIKKRDFEVAMRGRTRLHRAFNEHLNALEGVAVRLGAIYRQAAGGQDHSVPLSAGLEREESLPDAFLTDTGAHTRAIDTMSEYIERIADEYGTAVTAVTVKIQLWGEKHADA